MIAGLGRLALVCALGVAPAAAQDIAQADIKRLTLEELMQVDVTSVSRRAGTIAETAAAVTVITSEDIRRSGVTSIPDALRLVPGLQVARFNAGSWAISARGFNSTAADKLLVMIDGRTVYSPLFSGTFWEVQDLVLDDIARIEVVRGPGATLWGANAINGVVNIITKTAYDTTGAEIDLTGGGADDLAIGSVRAGADVGNNAAFRVFGKYFYRDQMEFANGNGAKDSVRIGRSGFRADAVKGDDEFTLEGDAYRGLEGILARPDAKVLGGYLLGRWTHRISNTSDLQIQTYYSRDLRRVPLQSDFRQRIFDFDLQHEFQISRHTILWGAEYRWNSDTTFATPVLSFAPPSRTYPLETAFVLDEISLVQDRVKLQAGSKFEHNDFTGFEAQPSVRASWSIHEDQIIWGAVTRAVRTPTRFDSDIRFGPPGLQIVGNPNFRSEEASAYEAGYRGRLQKRVSLDAALFYNHYGDLRSLERQTSGAILIMNHLNARAYGAEVAATYDLETALRFSGGYAYLGKQLRLDPGHTDVFNGALEGNDPTHQFFLRASADIGKNVELDSTLRYVSQLPAPVVPGYVEADARIGWLPTAHLSLSLNGRNLLHAAHPEFGPPTPTREEVERNVFGRVTFKF